MVVGLDAGNTKATVNVVLWFSIKQGVCQLIKTFLYDYNQLKIKRIFYKSPDERLMQTKRVRTFQYALGYNVL